jgi:hypothetical protein
MLSALMKRQCANWPRQTKSVGRYINALASATRWHAYNHGDTSLESAFSPTSSRQLVIFFVERFLLPFGKTP